MSADFTRLAPVAVNLLRSVEIDGANSRAQIFRMVMDIIRPRRFMWIKSIKVFYNFICIAVYII